MLNRPNKLRPAWGMTPLASGQFLEQVSVGTILTRRHAYQANGKVVFTWMAPLAWRQLERQSPPLLFSPPHPWFPLTLFGGGSGPHGGPYTRTLDPDPAPAATHTWARSGPALLLFRIEGKQQQGRRRHKKVWYQFDWAPPCPPGLRKLSVAWFKIRRAELGGRRD